MKVKTSNGMKVLLAASLYPPETRGPATFAGQLVRHLQAKNIPVEAVLFRDVRKFPPLLRHAVYFLKLLMRGRKVSIVIALDPVSVGFAALCAARILRAPLVLRIGGDYAWEQGVQRAGITDLLDAFVAKDKREYPVLIRTLWFLQCFVASRAERVVVPSEYLRGTVERWGVEKKRISVIGSASTASADPFSKKETRQRVGWGSEPVVCSLGQLVPWKGFSGLIDAVGSLRDEFPAIRLIIVGGGPQGALRARALQRGFDPQTVFLGELPHTIFLDLLAAADVFALNTAYEGLSHVLIEAMRSGIPVVTTDIGGNPELVENGKTGLLVPLGDTKALAAAIREILKNKSKASSLAAAARAAAEAFAPERAMRAWEKLLKIV